MNQKFPFLALSLYVLVCVVVGIKIWANSAYFLTPDSGYYLQAAENLLAGRGYLITFEGRETFCSIWPIGYSALIAATAWLTSLPTETASKIVNLLALGLGFWLVGRRYREKAWWVSLAFLASSFIQLYTNTWSETVFIVTLIGFCLMLEKQIAQPTQTQWTLLAWAVAAFLTRYAGVFLLPILLFKKQWKAATGLACFITIYLSFNYLQTGTFTGGHGFWPSEPFGERALRGLKGIGEEIVFWGMRDWDLKKRSLLAWQRISVYVVVGVQVGLLVFVGTRILRIGRILRIFQTPFFTVGMAYFAFTILIYLTDESLESLYFRRLTPATLLLLISFLGQLATHSAYHPLFEQVKWPIALFFLLSLWHSFPKF